MNHTPANPSRKLPETKPRFEWYSLAIGLTVAGAAGLRLAWLGGGLPDVPYVDAFKFVDAARAMVESGSLRPTHFQNPALYPDLLALVDWVFRLQSPYALHLAARAATALAGVGLVGLVGLAAGAALGRAGALVATLLAATDVLLVTLARMPSTDTLLVCWLTLGLWAVARERIERRHVAVAAVALGLATAAKWTGLYLALFYVAALAIQAVLRRRWRRPAVALAAALAGGAAVFLLFNPFFFAHFHDYFDRALVEADLQRYGQIGRVQAGWLDYFFSRTPTWEAPWLGVSLWMNCGALVLGAALAGGWLALARRRSRALALHVLFVAGYLAIVVRPGHLMAARFLAPILPSSFILAGHGVEALCERLTEGRRSVVMSLVVLGLAAVPLKRSASYVWRARRPMTQLAAADWIRRNLPPDARLFVTPLFLPNLDRLPQTTLYLSDVGSRQYRLPGRPDSNCELAPIYDAALLDDLRGQGMQYVVTNSWFDGAFGPVPGNERWFPNAVVSDAAWRGRLKSEGRAIWSIKADEVGALGPDIVVYELNRHGLGD